MSKYGNIGTCGRYHCRTEAGIPGRALRAALREGLRADDRGAPVRAVYGRAGYPTLDAFAEADVAEVEGYVHSCGFYKHKAEDIVLACRMLRDEYGGKVPGTMEQLLRLPGVGRKTANLLLGDIYGTPGSVVCDTHCIRICNLLGLASGKDPAKVEQQLRAILPPEESSDFCHRLVLHGRAVCAARKPACDRCCLAPYCKSFTGE